MAIKPGTFANTVLLGCLSQFVSGEAIAACNGPALTQAALVTALTGNTVCAMRGADRWQELHQAGGNLIDYKRGPADKIDPSEKVGTWSITANPAGNNANVVYNYGAGGTYTYSVRSNGGNSYSFCGGPNIDVMIKPGGGPCP
jgi:hypothetical protein